MFVTPSPKFLLDKLLVNLRLREFIFIKLECYRIDSSWALGKILSQYISVSILTSYVFRLLLGLRNSLLLSGFANTLIFPRELKSEVPLCD